MSPKLAAIAKLAINNYCILQDLGKDLSAFHGSPPGARGGSVSRSAPQRESKMRLFRFRAVVTIRLPGAPRSGRAYESGARNVTVHARHIGPPPGDRYFPAAMTWEEPQDLWSGDKGDKAVVTITVADEDALDYLAAGRPFTLCGSHSGHGVVTRQVYTDGSPS